MSESESIFEYEMGDLVCLKLSDERGTVIGRAEYASANEPCYRIRYKSAQGRLVEEWWDESAISHALETN